ncbi:nuclear transport factor 2 family protein [Streptomyces sp. CA2R101]|uniref:nuclear transport factor 2 family protein n=1 Tax=Streptomyces sp. CA2R101 TaxID=3120152 RepID=UPI00300BD3AC
MTSALPISEKADEVTGDLYYQVQSFYARQMQLLDSGRVDAWADTFTEDGVFSANAQPRPAAGREAIRRAAAAAQDALRAKGLRHRHWLGMVDIRSVDGDRVTVRNYALVLAIPLGGQATVHVSTTCNDELVREDGQWRVRNRVVFRDDLEGGGR